jgi:hypothetical protein
MPAPRLGALAQLQLGRNLQHRQAGWCLDQNAGITKMGKDEWSSLLPSSFPILERYPSVERRELLKGGTSDHLWIARGGGVLTEAGITGRLKKL